MNMEDISHLETLSQKGYSSLIEKISAVYNLNRDFAYSVSELNELTDNEYSLLKRRGKIERRLNEARFPKVMLMKTYLPKNNNTFVLAETGYRIDDFLNRSDEDLGLFIINDDVLRRTTGQSPRILGIRAELAQIRNRKLTPIPRNRSSPVINLYGIKELYVSQEQILSHCIKDKLGSRLYSKIKELTSPETRHDLLQGTNTKRGLDGRDVKRILKGII